MRKTLFRFCIVATVCSAASWTAAHTQVYEATLDGPSEFPANPSPATGFVRLTVDLDLFTMRVQANFSGLLGNSTAAHIHGPIPDAPANPLASVITQTPSYPGFPLGVTAGSMDQTFDMLQTSSYNSNQTFVNANGGAAGAFNAFIAGLNAGKMYFNIHTTNTASGEIRGFPQLVPEPASASLAVASVAGLVAIARRRRSR